jgi:hypothetical protein
MRIKLVKDSEDLPLYPSILIEYDNMFTGFYW